MIRYAHGVLGVALVCATVCLVGCSKNEPQAPVNPSRPAAPAIVTPVPESAAPPPPAPEPTVELHIPGTPEAKAFVAANAPKHHPKSGTSPVPAPNTAYDVAYRNAARADKLLHRHAYVVSFDDGAATNAVALNREYR